MGDNTITASSNSKVVVLKIDTNRLADIKMKLTEQEKSNEQEKPPEKPKKRRRKSTKTEKPNPDDTQRTKVGRPRKGTTIKRSDSVEAVEATEATDAVQVEAEIKAKEIEKINAEVRTANRESKAYLVSKHMDRWTKMAREPIDSMETETVLVKLSSYTCAIAVPVPISPTHASPSVQALVAKSHYVMREVDEAIREDDKLQERATNQQRILIEGPPKINLHGHPSPPVSYTEPAFVTQRVQPVQPLPHLLTSVYPLNSRDPNDYLAAATRDHALKSAPRRNPGMDIDLKTVHLRNIRALNMQYNQSPQSAEVLKAARSAAHAQNDEIAQTLPSMLKPPRQDKALSLHDRLLSEMEAASERLHYRRRVLSEYRRHVAAVCRTAFEDDIRTRGPFVEDVQNVGGFVTTSTTNDGMPPIRGKVLKLGYRRRGLRPSRHEIANRPGAIIQTVSMPSEQWRRVVETKGASLTRGQRRRLGFDILEDQEMHHETVKDLMSAGNAFDVNRDVQMMERRSRASHFGGQSALFRGYVR